MIQWILDTMKRVNKTRYCTQGSREKAKHRSYTTHETPLATHGKGITCLWWAHKLISTQCHIYASVNWLSIGSSNGLAPERRQAITWTNAEPVTWTNAGLLSIGPLGTNFSEIWIKIQKFSFTKMHLKMSSAKKKTAILSRGRWVKESSHKEI